MVTKLAQKPAPLPVSYSTALKRELVLLACRDQELIVSLSELEEEKKRTGEDLLLAL